MIEEPSKLIYDTLKAISGVTVYQNRPEILPENQMPIVLFSVVGNSPLYTLQKDVANQKYEVNVEIYAKDSVETTSALKQVESAMRNIDFLMSGSINIPDPENYSHKSVKFVY